MADSQLSLNPLGSDGEKFLSADHLSEVEKQLQLLVSNFAAKQTMAHVVTAARLNVALHRILSTDNGASAELEHSTAAAPSPKRFYRTFWRGISRKLLRLEDSVSSTFLCKRTLQTSAADL
jgi:hypothetical protein